MTQTASPSAVLYTLNSLYTIERHVKITLRWFTANFNARTYKRAAYSRIEFTMFDYILAAILDIMLTRDKLAFGSFSSVWSTDPLNLSLISITNPKYPIIQIKTISGLFGC